MPELQSFLQQSLSSLQPELSRLTQAHMIIPFGLVQGVRQSFEDIISAHRYDLEELYINRAMHNARELTGQNRTYAEQLRITEEATLFNLPTHLVEFLRDHNNLYYAAIRSRLAANRAITSPHIEVLVRLGYRLRNIRNFYYINIVEETGSMAEHLRLMQDPLLKTEFRECTTLLQNETIDQLTRAHRLFPGSAKNTELENIGPDHNVSDHGHEITLATAPPPSDARDHSQDCCICLEPYTATTHPAFRITACNHIIGKPCLTHWLNGTTLNANLCPHCRIPLCKRRARQLAGITPEAWIEQRVISDRVKKILAVIQEVEKLQKELFGADAADAYITQTMEDLNYRLYEGDVEFCLVRRGTEWMAGRFNWHDEHAVEMGPWV